MSMYGKYVHGHTLCKKCRLVVKMKIQQAGMCMRLVKIMVQLLLMHMNIRIIEQKH